MLNSGNLGKYIVFGLIALVILVIAAIGWTVANPPKKEQSGTSKALKAQSVKELGRNHVTDISGQQYSSNPPTSGTHFPLWAKRGVYKELISDGYLIHSLEHGYIVISYNCGTKGSGTYTPLKKGDKLAVMEGDPKDTSMRPFTPDTAPKEIVTLPEAFSTASCQSLVKNLSQFLDTYQRIVVVPRPNMDSVITLAAWGKIDKMDTFDKNRINAFIEAFHNKGPEQTVE